MDLMLTTRQQLVMFLATLAITAVVVASDVLAQYCWGSPNTYSGVWKRLFGSYGSLWAALLFWLGYLAGHLTPAN